MIDTKGADEIGAFPLQGECVAAWEAFHGWKNKLLDLAADHPAEALFTVVAGGAMVFYLAERDVNDDVATYGDALHYISTCLSVGYARIFPMTQIGKLVATIVMAIGPGLTAWVIEGRLTRRNALAEANTPPQPDPIVERLDAILQELKAQRTNGSAGV